jgi:5-methyltetrahydrofolate--homocysteine methyltransferase
MDQAVRNIFDNILEGQLKPVTTNVQAALDAGITPPVILNEGMIAAMAEVGRLFEEGEYFVPEMLIAARAMQVGLAHLKPYLSDDDVKPKGKVIIGTVKGDLHDIGKNLVGMMMEGAGFEVKDLGTDVAPGKFVEAHQSEGGALIALSALLTTTMPNMKAVIDAFQTAGLRDQVKIIVGGALVTEGYAKQIGADGYSSDASRAVSLANSLVA